MIIKWLLKKQVITQHQKAIERDGGDSGILDETKIESALNTNCLSLLPIPEIAAKFVYRLTLNHAFIDGNKRTAFASGNVFLKQNGYRLLARPRDAERLIKAIASDEGSENDCLAFYASYCERLHPSKTDVSFDF